MKVVTGSKGTVIGERRSETAPSAGEKLFSGLRRGEYQK